MPHSRNRYRIDGIDSSDRDWRFAVIRALYPLEPNPIYTISYSRKTGFAKENRFGTVIKIPVYFAFWCIFIILRRFPYEAFIFFAQFWRLFILRAMN